MLKKLQEQEEYRGDSFAGRPETTQREEDLDGRDEALDALRGS